MNYLKIILTASLLAISSASIAEVINWTVGVQKLYVANDEIKIFVKAPTEPNPSASWNCTSNLVSLGNYSDPVPLTLKYSTAMEAYKSGATARVGIEGSGSTCLLTYITLNEKP